MRRKKIVSMLLVATMAATLFAGCGSDSGKKGSSETGDVKEFDAFFATPGSEINDDNEIQKIIEEKTGVRVKETWLTGQTADEAVGTMIAGGEYPDFIEGASGQKQLYDAGALVPLDDNMEFDADSDIYLYRYSEDENGEPELGNIEDDDEYEAAADAFDEWMDTLELEDSDEE